MGNLIILGALLLAAVPTVLAVILCRKFDGTMWKWVLFGLLDSMFLMAVIVEPSAETVLYLIGGIAAETAGYYTNEHDRNGTVWFFMTAATFVILYTMITEPGFIYSSGFFSHIGVHVALFNVVFLEAWISALFCAFMAKEKGKIPVVWFMIGIATLGIPAVLVLLLDKKKS